MALAGEELKYQHKIPVMINKKQEKVKYFFTMVNLMKLERRIANTQYSKIVRMKADKLI
jgi:hypothetical protein